VNDFSHGAPVRHARYQEILESQVVLREFRGSPDTGLWEQKSGCVYRRTSQSARAFAGDAETYRYGCVVDTARIFLGRGWLGAILPFTRSSTFPFHYQSKVSAVALSSAALSESLMLSVVCVSSEAKVYALKLWNMGIDIPLASSLADLMEQCRESMSSYH
jgi:hypothetical protein